MPKISHVKIKNKDGLHPYICKSLVHPITNIDLIPHDVGYSNYVPYYDMLPENKEVRLAYVSKTIKNTTGTDKTLRYKPTIFNSGNRNFSTLNKFTDSINDDVLSYFYEKSLDMLNGDLLLGYGDELKFNANNIFTKGKKYAIEFFRSYSNYGLVYGEYRDGMGSFYKEYDYQLGRDVWKYSRRTSNVLFKHIYTVSGSGEQLLSIDEYPYDGDSTKYKYYAYADYGGTNPQTSISGIQVPEKNARGEWKIDHDRGFLYDSFLLDPSKSYLNAHIRLGYEFTYIDGTTETFLTDKHNEIESGYYIGRMMVMFTPSKDIASVKFVMKFEGAFNYGKIFGKLKKLINDNHYPTLSTTYRTNIKNTLDCLDSYTYGDDSIYTSIDAYKAAQQNGSAYPYVYPDTFLEINPATGKVRCVYTPSMTANYLDNTNMLTSDALHCRLGISSISTYEVVDSNIYEEYVNDSPLLAMSSYNGSFTDKLIIGGKNIGDNIYNYNLNLDYFSPEFKNLKTKTPIKKQNGINSFILKDDIVGSGMQTISDYVFKEYNSTDGYGYYQTYRFRYELETFGIYTQLESMALVSYTDIIFDKDKHRFLHLYLENLNLPNKKDVNIRIEYFFSEKSRDKKGFLSKHRMITTPYMSAGSATVIDHNSIYGHTWVGYNRYDNQDDILDEIDVPSYCQSMYGIWNWGNFTDIVHGHKLRICIFMDNVDVSTINEHHRLDLAVSLSPNSIPGLHKKKSEEVTPIEIIFKQQNINSYDDYLENTCEPCIVTSAPPPGFYFKHDVNLEYFISGDGINWYKSRELSLNESYKYSTVNYNRWMLDNNTIPITEEIEYASISFDIDYKSNYHNNEDQSKHTYDLSFEDGVYKHKAYPEVIINKNASLGDIFKSFNNFYYETLDHKVIDNMYDKHEWFRLYGVDRESDIDKIISFNRSTKESTILINNIPIDFTKHKLLEYNDFEFIAIYGDLTINEFGVLYTKEINSEGSKDGVYINNKGVVNFDNDGILVDLSSEYKVFGPGINYIPDGYVCSKNYIMYNASNKIKEPSAEIVFLNKIVYVPASMKVYIPIKRSTSIFENVMKLFHSWTVKNPTESITDLLAALKVTDNTTKSIQTNFYNSTFLYPDLDTIVNENATQISADIESYLYQTNEAQRNFVIEESKHDLLLFKNNPYGLDIKMPKLLIPYENRKGYQPVLFMNGLLLSAKPEIIKTGNKEYIIIDLCEVYSKQYEDFDYDYNTCINWYRINKATEDNEHVFEVELYPEDTKILETTCTRFNENFVPIPLDFLEEIKVKGDYCFEVYLDGRLLHPSYYKLDVFGKKNDLTNTLNVPAIYFSKRSGTYFSTGSRVTVIKKKDIRIISYDISSLTFPIVHNTKFNKYSKFYYANGRKIPESRIIRLTPHLVLLKDLRINGYTKSFSSYTTFTGTPFIMVSNEIYDLTNSISTHMNFSESLYSIVASYYSYIFTFDSELKVKYLDSIMDKSGTFLIDSDFDKYVNLCKNSLKDNLSMNDYNTSGFFGQMSPYAFKVRQNDNVVLDFSNDTYLAMQVSYIYSLLINNFMSARDIARFSESLFDLKKDAVTTRLINKTISIPDNDTILSKYNYFVINHLSTPSIVNKESLTKQILSNNDAALFYYTNLMHIPKTYGILPKEWCSRKEPINTDTPEINKVRLTFTE